MHSSLPSTLLRASRRPLVLLMALLVLFTASASTMSMRAEASTASSAKSTAAKAAAVKAAVGDPAEPTLVWSEDFENGQGDTPTKIGDYVSDNGTKYTTGTFWSDYANCNGVITNYRTGLPLTKIAGSDQGQATFPSGMCTTGVFNGNYSQVNMRRMVDVLGQVGAGSAGGTTADPTNASTATTQNNHAVAEWTTEGSAAAGDTTVFSAAKLPVTAPSNAHYYTTAVDVAETSCAYRGGVNNSKLDFYLNLDGTETKVNTDPIQACTDPRLTYYTSPVPANLTQSTATWGNAGAYVGAGHFYSDRALLLTPAQMSNIGLIMRNQTLSGSGNDFAVDNIRLYDATPSMAKSFSPTTITQGGTSRLTFTITNTADLAEKAGWSYTDDLPDNVSVASNPNVSTTCLNSAATDGSSAAVSTTSDKITVNGSLATNMASCTVSLDVTSDTVGTYTNGAKNVTPNGLNPPGDATLTVNPRVDLAITKSANLDSYTPGSPITYTVTVTNAASTAARPISTATDAKVSDAIPSSISGASWTCAASDGASCSAGSGQTLSDTVTIPAGGQIVYTVSGTVESGTTGQITNTATVVPPTTITPPGSDTPYPVTDDDCSAPDGCSATVKTPGSGIAVVKTATPTTITKAGTPVTYTFKVTNTGGSVLTDVHLGDTFTSGGSGTLSAIDCQELTTPAATCSGTSTTLQPDQSATFTATYTSTQADVDNGKVTNTATATGTPPSGPDVTDTDDATVTADQSGAISIVKSADPTTVAKAGEKVTYSFDVTNTGNVTLSKVDVTDDDFSGTGELSAIDCPQTTLAAGASMTCTATYTVTQADIDAGKITNTATAHGTPPGSDTPVNSPPSSTTVTASKTPALTVVKTADPTTVQDSGDKVTYSFKVTNTGNVTLTKVNVTDDAFSGTGTLSAIDCPQTTLAPGDSTTCTATYAVTQADIDAGKITNTATAHGNPPGSDTPVDSPPSSAVVTAGQTPALTIEKTADPTTVASAGQQVTYSFKVTNAGNVTLKDVNVTDDAFSGTGTLSAIDCPQTTLEAHESMTCTATYTVTQADIDAGKITNTATAHGTPPGSDTPVNSPPSSAVVTAPSTPALTIVKSADPQTVAAAGDKVTYSFLVTNTGNVTLSKVNVTDDDFSGTGKLSAIDCPQTTLAAGASMTCTATYTVTQADIDAGKITNTATAHGNPTGSDTPVNSPPSSTTVTASKTPALTVVKTADPTTVSKVGEKVTYSFKVTNTGNVTLTKVDVTDDDFSGTGKLSAIDCPKATLDPGDSMTCTATYTVTQADIDAGKITNTATAHGNPPGSDTPVTSPPSSTTVTTERTPAITVVKSASPTLVSKVGEKVTYSFKVTNTGSVTLKNVQVTDTAFSGTGKLSAIDCPTTTLAAGESTTCTATYTVTQADIDAGKITNTAISQGTPPGSDTPVKSPPSEAVVNVTRTPGITVVKTADRKTVSKVGEKVTYSFKVTNTGNVTLTKVKVTDTAFSGTGKLSAIDCPTTTLRVGESMTCTATYTVTQADLTSGKISNTAVSQGTPPSGKPITSPPSTVVVTPSGPHAGTGGYLVRQNDRGTPLWETAVWAAAGIMLLGAAALIWRRRRA